MRSIEWHHYWWPLETLKVTVAVLNLSVSHTLGNTEIEIRSVVELRKKNQGGEGSGDDNEAPKVWRL